MQFFSFYNIDLFLYIVLQRILGLIFDLFEFFLGCLVATGFIGVITVRKFPVGFPDVFERGVAGDAQPVIKVVGHERRFFLRVLFFL